MPCNCSWIGYGTVEIRFALKDLGAQKQIGFQLRDLVLVGLAIPPTWGEWHHQVCHFSCVSHPCCSDLHSSCAVTKVV